jgi:transposase InsO family protein
MTRWLGREGYAVSRKRVQRLMRKMGLEALYPRPRTTVPHPEHKIYPYLLREREVVPLSAKMLETSRHPLNRVGRRGET